MVLSPTTTIPASATKNVVVEGNLPSDLKVGEALPRDIEVFDAKGAPTNLSISFARTGGGWTVTVTDVNKQTIGTATLDADGKMTAGGTNGVMPTSAGIDVHLGALTGYAGLTTVAVTGQDGSKAGTLEAFGLQPDGSLVGSFSNGVKQVVGRIALARFTNPEGLEKAGQSAYTGTANSGAAQIGAAGDPGFGSLAGGALEMSNVDLSQEFTNLIVAQRGFQANARIITSSDQVLQELVDLKR
jgi:flagellar hook protein FlgE